MQLDNRRRRIADCLVKTLSPCLILVGIGFVVASSRVADASQFAWGEEDNGFSVAVSFDSAVYAKGEPVTGFVALRTSKTLSDKILCHGLSDYGFTIIPSGSTKAIPTTLSFDFSGPLEKLAKVLEPSQNLEQRFDLAQFSKLPPGKYSVQVERSVQYLGARDAGPSIADPNSLVAYITINP